MFGTHWSRHFDGPGHLEYQCPCPKAPCGMVAYGEYSSDCDQHPFEHARTTRSSHPAEQCPGVQGDVITGFPDHYIVNGDTSSCPCVLHDPFFRGMREDDWVVPEGTAFVQREDGGWVPVGVTVQGDMVLHVEPREDDIDFLSTNPFVNYRQRYVMTLEPEDGLTLDPVFAPGGYLMGYCEEDARVTAQFFEGLSRIPDYANVVANHMTSVRDNLNRMGELLGELREVSPHLFEDIDEIPMSGDAMRVSWNSDMEEKPL